MPALLRYTLVGTFATGVHYLLAQVFATLFVLGLTFAINRHWTFR